MAAPAAPSTPNALIAKCLESLRTAKLHASMRPTRARADEVAFEGVLTVATGRTRSPIQYLVEAKRTHLSYALIDGLVSRLANLRRSWVLFAPYVASPMARYLTDRGVNYVDAVGNCHLTTASGRDLLVHVEGKRARRAPASRGAGRVPAYQVLFALLAQPALLDGTVRSLALAAGVGKTAAADQLARLRDQAIIGATRSGHRITRPRELLDRWLAGYADIVRPHWLVGRYRLKDGAPDAVEAAVADAMRRDPWALGGASAAWRMTGYYRAEDVVVHAPQVPADLTKRLRALPSDHGNLVLLQTPPPVAYEGTEPRLAHPLLVYTEMITSSDERTRNAAARIRELLPAELRA